MAKDLNNPARIPDRHSVEELLESGFGQHGNFFFHDADDKSNVIVMFNGRNTHRTFEAGGKIFNRWTWAEHFRHPVIIVNDPLANNRTGLRIAWYLGHRNGSSFSNLWAEIEHIIQRIAPSAKRIAFGSSGGGFAAIQSLLHGYADSAFAINPQTDIRLSTEYRSEDVLLEYTGGDTLTESDIPFISLIGAAEINGVNGDINYAQNISDRRHYTRHMIPFIKAIGRANVSKGGVSLKLFDDVELKHGAPSLSGTVEVFGERFAVLLKPK